MPRTEALRWLAPIALTAWLSGCAAAPPMPPLMANTARSGITVSELRAMDYEYAARFGQMVAVTAMEIVEQTDDEEVRERAYRWRMWATPQARAAAFDQDPVGGLLELWALAGQQHRFLGDGEGSQALKDQQALAVATASKLEDQARALGARVIEAKLFEDISARIDAWIIDHPIEGWFSVRPTARADLASLAKRQTQGGLQAVGSIEETFRDLNDRLAILTLEVPEEMRWQAEYLTRALFEERFEEPTRAAVSVMGDVSAFLRGFEETLAEETDAFLEGFRGEREAIFDAVRDERMTILDAVERAQSSVLLSLDEQVTSAAEKLDQVGRGLIDYFFLRLFQALAVIGLFVLLLVALVLFVLRRRRNED